MGIEDKILEAQTILKLFELPQDQQGRIAALTLLALCEVKPNDKWENAERKSMGITKGIMDFVKKFYHAEYKPNTRESFRKSALISFVENSVAELNPDDPDLKPTSSKTHYAISNIALNTVRKFNTSEWEIALENFLKFKIRNQPKRFENVVIRTLNIVSYKSIVDDKIELGRFNVFIGANGCGKTNILEAIATMGADRAHDLNFDGLYSRGVRIARPDLILSSFLNSKQSNSVDISVSMTDGNVLEEYKCFLAPANLNDIYTKWINLADEEIYPEQLLVYFNELASKNPNISGSELLSKANELLQNRGGRKERSFDSLLCDFSIFDLNTKSLRGVSPAESKKTPLGLNGEGLDLLIASFNVHERELLNQCLYFFDWLKEVIADKDDKYKTQGLKPGRSISTLYFRDKFMGPDNNTLSAENSNEGILHVLFYLTLFISNSTPQILGIDNIETALNPRLCQALITGLVRLSKDRDKQALITTHNPAILDGLNLLDDEQRLFEVYRDSQGRTKTRRIKFKNDLSDKKFKLSEMWLKGLLGAVPKNF